jgi:LysM repeat protein
MPHDYISVMKTLSPFGAVLVLCGLGITTGCNTLGTQQRIATVRTQSEMDRISAEVAKLKERVEALAVSQQQLCQQVESVQASVRDENARTRQNLADMDRAVKAFDETQRASRQEIEDLMVKRVSAAISHAQPAAQAQRVERGYEHVVQAGQTLSEIASAYKVKPQDIIKANKLQNPNALRVGQKLFIPE